MADEERLYDEILFATRKHFSEKESSKEEIQAFIESIMMFHLDIMHDFGDLSATLNRTEFSTRLFIQYWQEEMVRQQVGAFLVSTDDNTPWLPEKEETISWHYWDAYRQYLEIELGRSHEVVSTIGRDTHDILALTGDPTSKSGFSKKGLVVGSVQSGKTANYIGLMCRAADIGYQFIVVLAATTNDLRAQTQERIEDGFIGIDYTSYVNGQVRTPERVGVGKMAYSGFRHPNPGTTRTDDFNKTKMKSLIQVRDQNTSEPWVFVIKKNPHTLRNLIEWLRSGNLSQDENQLFLIDDEADYASINTKVRKGEITRINQQIRELLSLFSKSVYVGYTATPYANILIDQDAMNDEIGADIFPRNFIYTLSAADSYFGASKVFEDIDPVDVQSSSRPKYVRFISEADRNLIPPSARAFTSPVIPASMLDAIRTFVLASTVRLMRKGSDTHTSMLINISPYNNVQRGLKSLVDEYVDERLKPAFRMYGYRSADTALANSLEIREVKRCWDAEYANRVEFTWENVFPHIQPLVMKYIRTAEVNSRSREGLYYRDQIEHVVAIGGYRLSRGLTLEGLLVSYFSRNSRAYDTLLQMSRWFGHRVGYEDLCRVWMTEESAGWCRFVADATEELMYDFIRMQQQHKTPLEFGQRVRAHPGTLMVTARNKMGSGELVGDVSLNGKLVEASVLRRNDEDISHNRAAADALLTKLESQGYRHELWKGNVRNKGGYGILFRHIPRVLVEEFIGSFRDHPASMNSQSAAILEQIGYCTDEGLNRWTILFAAVDPEARGLGDTEPRYFECCGQRLRMQRRSPGNRTDADVIYIGNRYKVSTTEIDSVGLPEEVQKQAIREWQSERDLGHRVSIDYFFRLYRKGQEPLLVVHYLDISFLNESEYLNARRGLTSKGKESREGSLAEAYWDDVDKHVELVSWSISFPPLKRDRHVRYVFNKVMLEQMGLYDDQGDEEQDDPFND